MESPPNTIGVTVYLPAALRGRAAGRAIVAVTGTTIGEIIDMLDRDFPGLKFNLCHETGDVRPYVNLFLNGVHIRYLRGVQTPVPAGATLHILQSVAGG
jgi:molybdopterin synthase sulfur carrier subunit